MTKNTKTKQTTSKNKPVHTIRFGSAKAAIWQNQSGHHSISLERIYKDGAEKWQSSQSFGRDDLPKLINALEATYRYLYSEDSNSKS